MELAGCFARRLGMFLLVILIVCGWFCYLYFENAFTYGVKSVRVEGVPPHSDLNVYGAYDGPHPRFMSRPSDPFQYPIPIGKTGPLAAYFSGPQEYPFVCMTERSNLGQPLVDNRAGYGMPVIKNNIVVGYSKDCQLNTAINYYYRKKGTDQFLPYYLDTDATVVDKIQRDGGEVPFVVRVESGTINRFIYLIAVVVGPEDSPQSPDMSRWNERLVFQFYGGVGIGHKQGTLSPVSLLKRRSESLARGYAVVTSTGNETSNHYNLWLSEEVALRVKNQFISRYGEPLFTIGIGGSGGAIQQYLLAQNNPNIIDGALALYSYPDMVTQTAYAYDCELLEYYFDVTDSSNKRWESWDQRRYIAGMNASKDVENKYQTVFQFAKLFKGSVQRALMKGSSECVIGWRGLTQTTINPQFVHFSKYLNDDIVEKVSWTFWSSMRYLFGTDEKGEAGRAWDNTGIQYGLNGLKAGLLDMPTFLNINRFIGGWKPTEDMKKEKMWVLFGDQSDSEIWEISPWSEHNMTHDGKRRPAPRAKGDEAAIRAAYQSGHVFLGMTDIPIIDLRHYLENQLDMHHFAASFASRLRLQDANGHYDNQIIWVSDRNYSPIPVALEMMDDWLTLKVVSGESTLASKPLSAVDMCTDEKGDIIASGEDVWDGVWNAKPNGACMDKFPTYQTSRIAAGEDFRGIVLKCHLQSVDQAIVNGVYGSIDVSYFKSELQSIFPDGVCDYSKLPVGFPKKVMQAYQLLQPSEETAVRFFGGQLRQL